MKIVLYALFLLGLAIAIGVTPNYIDTKNTGQENLSIIDVGTTIDCQSKQLTINATAHESGEQVADGKIYLFYTNYGYQPIGSGKTDGNGIGKIEVVGNMNYLTALFVLRVDKPGLRSKEIEFTYQKCFEEISQGLADNDTIEEVKEDNESIDDKGIVEKPTPDIPIEVNVSEENETPTTPAVPVKPETGCMPALILALIGGFVMRR